jgi:hypothetical protein
MFRIICNIHISLLKVHSTGKYFLIFEATPNSPIIVRRMPRASGMLLKVSMIAEGHVHSK